MAAFGSSGGWRECPREESVGSSPQFLPQSERICYGIDIHGIDIDCRYIDVAVQRWEKFSGKLAKLASDGQTLEQAREERHR